VTSRVDASGVAVPITGRPRRIVCLIPSTSELLCGLGLGDALVGVSVYCVEPRAIMRAKAKVGGEKNPDLDAIRALEPDLVIANIEENVREHVETLRGWGLRVWVTYPRTVDGAIAMIRDLGHVTATEEPAERMADALEADVRRVRDATAARPRVRVFYPIWRGPYMTVNRDTYIHDVLALCGADNVFADAPERYPVVTLDEAAARAPDVIVLPDEPFRFRRAHLADWQPFPAVPAVRDGRMHLMDGKLFCWHGPRLAEALSVLPSRFAGASASV
jgi:ABC-type Fe3+-hydroxamate transport system substrate-binding protein